MVFPPPRMVYDTTGLPPLEDGRPNRIVTRPFPATALTLRGAAGTVTAAVPGVTSCEGREAALVPLALRALTVKLSALPLVRPVSLAYPVERNWVAGIVAVWPEADRTTYAVTGEAPSLTGGTQET